MTLLQAGALSVFTPWWRTHTAAATMTHNVRRPAGTVHGPVTHPLAAQVRACWCMRNGSPRGARHDCYAEGCSLAPFPIFTWVEDTERFVCFAHGTRPRGATLDETFAVCAVSGTVHRCGERDCLRHGILRGDSFVCALTGRAIEASAFPGARRPNEVVLDEVLRVLRDAWARRFPDRRAGPDHDCYSANCELLAADVRIVDTSRGAVIHSRILGNGVPASVGRQIAPIFFCKATGKIHVCGSRECLDHSREGQEGGRVCPLTALEVRGVAWVHGNAGPPEMRGNALANIPRRLRSAAGRVTRFCTRRRRIAHGSHTGSPRRVDAHRMRERWLRASRVVREILFGPRRREVAQQQVFAQWRAAEMAGKRYLRHCLQTLREGSAPEPMCLTTLAARMMHDQRKTATEYQIVFSADRDADNFARDRVVAYYAILVEQLAMVLRHIAARIPGRVQLASAIEQGRAEFVTAALFMLSAGIAAKCPDGRTLNIIPADHFLPYALPGTHLLHRCHFANSSFTNVMNHIRAAFLKALGTSAIPADTLRLRPDLADPVLGQTDPRRLQDAIGACRARGFAAIRGAPVDAAAAGAE
jgi:hypothetical protein